MKNQDTIAAIATGQGGAIAVIRISGDQAIGIADAIFTPVSGHKLRTQKGFTIHYGTITENDTVIDDVLISLFRAPRSYTGEDMVEVSCHASKFIQQKILEMCVDKGARTADAGEFTMRAFMNGKMDLSQAEAVADVIAAETKSSHRLAANQMRGDYSAEFRVLRDHLIELVSLLELELDFSEEDVEFADRTKLFDLINLIEARISTLISSFSLGNIIKNGIPVAIIGAPNAGKSTLLNAILKEEKALVSEIAGTTRDIIEDTLNIDGIEYRFIDTAGIRETNDVLESMGIERTLDRMSKASIVLFLVDVRSDIASIYAEIRALKLNADQSLGIVLNKIDFLSEIEISDKMSELAEALKNDTSNKKSDTEYKNSYAVNKKSVFAISAKRRINIDTLLTFLSRQVDLSCLSSCGAIVFNSRHYEFLVLASKSLERAQEGLRNNLSGDLLSQDIREALLHLGAITGEITSDDILGSIFSKFCIGK